MIGHEGANIITSKIKLLKNLSSSNIQFGYRKF